MPGNMVKTFAALRHKFFDWGVRTSRLEEFDAAFSDIQHRHAHPLLVDLIVARELQAYCLLIYLHGCGKRFYGNTDVIDLHHGLPNFALRTILSTIEYGSCLRS